jgi:uncharacterized protein (TIGR04255 family)
MGKLKNAPVFYVVAQVTHSPVLKLDSLVPDLQEILRKEGFPGYITRKQAAIQFQLDPSAPNEPKIQQREITSHVFSKRDESESLIVSPGSFSLQTVEYDTIETFSATFATAIRAIDKILAPDSFTRIGLRFLDAVVPPNVHDLHVYIRPQFLGLQANLDDDWQVHYGFTEDLLMRNDQTTKLRVTLRASPVTWPHELAPTAPTLPKRFAEINGPHALLDTDSSFTVSTGTAMAFSEAEILKRLKSLKVDVRDTFNAVVTPEALQAWT